MTVWTRMPGMIVGRYAGHVTGDRAAEDVSEHQREDDRLDDDVEQLLGVVLDLENSAVRHRERVREALLQADAAGCGIRLGYRRPGFG